MGKRYTKTVSGREYEYERVSAKRIGGKVVTKDRYIGPVEKTARAKRPMKLESLSEVVRKNIEFAFVDDVPIREIQRRLRQPKWGGLKVSESAIRGYMKRYNIPRPSIRRGVRIKAAKKR